jgi:hypothetical protein
MARLFTSLKNLFESSDVNSAQFKAAAADACKAVEAEKKKSKLLPSGDGVLPSEVKPPKPKSDYTIFMSDFLHNYKGNPHNGMKEGAHYWKNGGKQEWENNNK